MPVQQPSERLQLRSRTQVSWRTITLFAVVITLADVFWMVTIRGAVGAIEHIQTPFSSWMRQSALLAPLFLLTVTGALLLARRVAGRCRPVVRVMGAAALIVVMTTGLAVATVAATSVIDYQAQAKLLGLTHAAHVTTALQTNVATTDALIRCDALCEARRETVQAHVRAVGYGSLILLATNVVLVLWLLALRGGRLFSSPSLPRNARSAEQAPGTAVALV